MVALTGLDEENIIMSLFAKTQGVEKIIAKVNESMPGPRWWRDSASSSIVAAKSATADAIMRYVRARKNSYSSANVETMYQSGERQSGSPGVHHPQGVRLSLIRPAERPEEPSLTYTDRLYRTDNARSSFPNGEDHAGSGRQRDRRDQGIM